MFDRWKNFRQNLISEFSFIPLIFSGNLVPLVEQIPNGAHQLKNRQLLMLEMVIIMTVINYRFFLKPSLFSSHSQSHCWRQILRVIFGWGRLFETMLDL
jgi:hypothetical protein